MHLEIKGCKMYDFPQVGDVAAVIDQGSHSSSGTVIRKQLVVGCILLY